MASENFIVVKGGVGQQLEMVGMEELLFAQKVSVSALSTSFHHLISSLVAISRPRGLRFAGSDICEDFSARFLPVHLLYTPRLPPCGLHSHGDHHRLWCLIYHRDTGKLPTIRG